jgi:hypothetical protein
LLKNCKISIFVFLSQNEESDHFNYLYILHFVQDDKKTFFNSLIGWALPVRNLPISGWAPPTLIWAYCFHLKHVIICLPPHSAPPWKGKIQDRPFGNRDNCYLTKAKIMPDIDFT